MAWASCGARPAALIQAKPGMLVGRLVKGQWLILPAWLIHAMSWDQLTETRPLKHAPAMLSGKAAVRVCCLWPGIQVMMHG